MVNIFLFFKDFFSVSREKLCTLILALHKCLLRSCTFYMHWTLIISNDEE
jgi:hypothetical protein